MIIAFNSGTEARRCGIVLPEANTCLPLKGDLERMARRRFQDPTPQRRGKWWTLRYRQDEFVGGRLVRVRKETRLALIEKTVRKRRAQTGAGALYGR